MGEHPRKDVQKGTFQELEEIKEYDGWGHDSGRNWRNADRWEKEDFHRVKAKFGERAFGLHHRFLGRLGPLGPLGAAGLTVPGSSSKDGDSPRMEILPSGKHTKN